ncbi:MAG: hypothetical protein WCX31_04660 [Salinivirgaceae bacterium]|jgi:prophage maintenance system killer protein
MNKTTNLANSQPNQKTTAAEKRYATALVYLHKNGINIYSRADDFYRHAIQIAAGVKVEKEV